MKLTIACVICALPLVTLAQQHSAQEYMRAEDSSVFDLDARSLTHQYMAQLPFRGEPQDYYSLFSGTVQQDYRGTEYLHIRGSRHDEMAYTFEGADVRSAYTGLNLIRFIPEALERIALQSSPTASEGPAVALLQHRLRRGGPDFKFTLRGESDRFTSAYKSRFDTYSYGYYNYLLTAEGKIVKDNIRFFAAGESESFADHYRKFWEGFSIGGPDFPMVDVVTGESMQSVFGTDEIVVRPGNIPHAAADRYNINSIVTADFSPFNLRAIGAYNWEKQQRNDTPIQDLFNPVRIPESKQNAGLLSLQADYAGPKNLNAHLHFDVLRSGEKTYDPLFEDDFLLYRDSLAIVAKGVPWNSPPEQYWDTYILGPRDFLPYYFHFSRPGELIASYAKSEENYFGIAGAMEKKSGYHQLLAGGGWQRRTLRHYAMENLLNFMRVYREFGLPPDKLNEAQRLALRNSGSVSTFGYDVFGHGIEDNDAVNDGAKHPSTYSLYFEDRYQVKDLQLSAGLRYDVFDSDALVFNDPANPEISSFDFQAWNVSLSSLRPAAVCHYLSPQFTAALMANDRLSLHFQFGKYVQQAQLRDLYADRGYLFRVLTGGFFIKDPRGFDAAPVRSTQTVLSLSYRLQPRLDFQTSLFYKLTEGLLEAKRIDTNDESSAADYNVLDNTGEATAKGVELTLHYNRNGLRTWINYALSDVKGFTSYPTSNLRDVESESFDPAAREPKAKPPSPLDFNQKHRGNALMSYQFDGRAPLLLRQTGLHLLFRFNSGHNFTLYSGPFSGVDVFYLGSLLSDYDPRFRSGVAKITTPWNCQFDLKIDRSFKLGSVPLKIYFYVQNLFDRKNVLQVYWRTGTTSDDGSFNAFPGDREFFLATYGANAFVLYDLINIRHRQHYQIRQGGDLFGQPREMRFGLQVDWGTGR